MLVSVDDAPPLLRNTAAKGNGWLGIKLVGRKSNRDAVGPRISYQTGDLKRSGIEVGGGSLFVVTAMHTEYALVCGGGTATAVWKNHLVPIDTPLLHVEVQISDSLFSG